MLIHGHQQPRQPNRVIVLGAGGFLGRALLQRLAQAEVQALGLSSRDLDLTASNASRLLADLLRPSDAVVMLAAVKSGRRLDEEGFLANLQMGTALCKAVREVQCSHLVYVSSDAVYPFISGPVREDVAPVPTSLYSLMHIARETMLRLLEGPPLAILRITQVYGFGDSHNAYGPSRMIRSALTEGRIVVYGSGEETRDHIHVADVAAILADMLAMRSRGLVDVATGRSLSFAELAEMIRTTCGGHVAIEREPPLMQVLHRKFDITALSQAFPARTLTSLEKGIALMVEQQRAAAASPRSAAFG
jgi:nucleoside-diphosphate-sugar epimerase